MELSSVTIGISGGLLVILVILIFASSRLRSVIFSVLSPMFPDNAIQKAATATDVMQRRCPHCAAAIGFIDDGRCNTCHREVSSVTRANNDRDAALNGTDSALQMEMVQKLATFEALSDADVAALLKLNAYDQSSDLQSDAQAALMNYFNITVDSTFYRYQTYRYDRFEHAVAYAKLDMDRVRLSIA